MKDPKLDQRAREIYASLKPNIADYVTEYAARNPQGAAIIEHNSGRTVTWKELDSGIVAFCGILRARGLKKGDIIATTLPLTIEHIYLFYACYRSGIIVAPLDLRLKTKEIKHCFHKINPSAYFFLGRPGASELREMIDELMRAFPKVRYWVQVQKEAGEMIEGVISLGDFTKIKPAADDTVARAEGTAGKRDPCLIIFTTGSTGSPKAALLCHENILIQCIGISVGFGIDENDRMLVNLPPSHVGCVTEQLGTILFAGGTAVILNIFDAQKSLDAIQLHHVTFMGQIPALFNMEWKLSAYSDYDLSSLKFAVYGGQSVAKDFLANLSAMAPRIGTGLGLTELGGFCTYTALEANVDELSRGLGYDSPLCPISVREPMKPDGRAGDEKPGGEIGEVCFSGAQVFPGYLNDEAGTKAALSSDGILYTGDLGSYGNDGLRFCGRKCQMAKPKGYQVFLEDVEHHIIEKLPDKVARVACTGHEHRLYSEAIIAFVEPFAEVELSTREVKLVCRSISTYARPAHFEIVKPAEIPLNRIGKTDYVLLRERSCQLVAYLRSRGKWDAKK